MDKIRPIYINITAMTIVKIILILVAFYLLFLIREILAILFIALILSSAVDPWVDWMQKKRIPRGMSILTIYILMISLLATAFYLVTPPIVSQSKDLIENFPHIFEKVISGFTSLKVLSDQYGITNNIQKYFAGISSNFEGGLGGIFSTVSGILGGVFAFFLVLVMTFYMAVEENSMKKIVWSVVPKKNQVYVMHLLNRMQTKIGLWLRGQLILSLIIFLLTFTALTIVNFVTGQMPYALVLALIAGLIEFVPYLGPIISAIPAVFLALTQSPLLAIVILLIYYVIQLFENNYIVPKVMQKVVGLNPIVSIAVLLIGFKLAGIAGAILAIPVATAVSVFVKDLFDNKVSMEEDFDVVD